MRNGILSNLFGVVVMSAALILAGWAGAEAQLTAKDFGQLPLISNLEISPDGKTVALFQPREGRNVLVTFSLVNPGQPKTTAFGKFEGFELRWVNNDYVLVTVAKSSKRVTGGSHFETRETRMIAIHKDGKLNPNIMLEPDKAIGETSNFDSQYAVNQGIFVHRLPGEEKFFLAENYENGYLPLSIFRVNVRTGKGRIVSRGNNETKNFVYGLDGEIRFRTDEYNANTEFFYRNIDGLWNKLANLKTPYVASDPVLGFDANGRTGYVEQQSSKTGKMEVYKYDFSADQRGERVFGHTDVDVDGMIFDTVTQEVIGVDYTVDQPEVHYLNERWRKRQAVLDQTFPNMAPHIVSSSDDRSKHIVTFSSPFVPATYYFYDEIGKKVTSLGGGYPKLKSQDLAEVVPIKYAARDGVKIKGYLTLPNGQGTKNLPLIVMPHGGPASRDSITFDYMAQFFAYRGYAVFQPNFRGSDGYGARFENAGNEEWGGLMSDDVTDGVKKLIDLGFADASRICIVGGSYGGYAALIGMVVTPDLYRCAVSINGVTDLLDFLDYNSKGHSGRSFDGYDVWKRRIGDPFKDRAKLIATSPARQAEKFKAPVLLLHNNDDRSVPFEQSKKMAAALKSAGKSHKLVVMEGGDHFLLTEKTRVRAMIEMDQFLGQYLQ